ncbi:transmembrane protein 158 [Perognathus longimembris pacificus]|uniref:transmembrane protein 158 n=1 Tax=Perognathus longimembris pacificus TaxID=214514 RepID=UPI002018D913|nr:transmembrane protein 158 [Perognathus longimembris pacificus]
MPPPPRESPPRAPPGSPPPVRSPPEPPPCNISVQRPLPSSLLVRWGGGPRAGPPPCDLLLFSTNAHGRAFFAAAFHRVGPPLLVEHPALAAGGARQDLRLCLGCGGLPERRAAAAGAGAGGAEPPAALRPAPGGGTPDPATAPPPPPSRAPAPPAGAPAPGPLWLQARPWHFCCLDFSLEELPGEAAGWRLNRKPIESTLVACFMTLVIVVWSVAALIWPVPIIAGFLPNGMEQRRTAAATAGGTAVATTAATTTAVTTGGTITTTTTPISTVTVGDRG